MSLEVKCDRTYFDEVKAFAASLGKLEQLQEKLDYLANYGSRPDVVCRLYKDFAPHSFRFTMYRGEARWFNGGLIYQGPDSPAHGGAPSFTVSLAEGIGWFVHT